MTTLEYKTHILADGAVAPIPGWTGGEAEAVIVVRPKREENRFGADESDWPNPTDEQLEKMYSLCRGCLKGMTAENLSSKNGIVRT